VLAVFVIAALLVALAEFGDKTQMLTLVLAARHGARPVLIGVALAIMALQAIAVIAGGLIGALIPEVVLGWIAGLLFIGFGVVTLVRGSDDEDVHDEAEARRGRGPVATSATAFFVAELGDKTQIMTMAIATNPASAAGSLGALVPGVVPTEGSWTTLLAVWAGSTVGMLAVNGLAAVVGHAVGSRLSAKLIARVSGVVFILFGVVTIAGVVGARG
jgi:putative Ca2+/H+ antiporter (TMEM165/GDT1 family)